MSPRPTQAPSHSGVHPWPLLPDLDLLSSLLSPVLTPRLHALENEAKAQPWPRLPASAQAGEGPAAHTSWKGASSTANPASDPRFVNIIICHLFGFHHSCDKMNLRLRKRQQAPSGPRRGLPTTPKPDNGF